MLQLVPNEPYFLHTPFFTPQLRIEIDKLPSNNTTLDQYIIVNLPTLLQPKIEHYPKVIEEFPQNITSSVFHLNGISALNATYVTDSITETGFADKYQSTNQTLQMNNSTQQTMQIWTIKKDKVYIISYSGITSPKTTSYTYAYYLPTIEKILNSITVG